MKTKSKPILLVILAFSLCTTLLFGAYKVSGSIKSSSVINSSYFLSGLLKESKIDIKQILTDPSQRAMMEKFLMALANAYIDFELIPHREAETFKVILSSTNADSTINSFKYSGKNLIIDVSGDKAGIENFALKLEEPNYFENIDLEPKKNIENTFFITCYAKEISPQDILG